MITRRCTQRQFLLRPDAATNNAFVYGLAVASLRTGVQIVAFVANSNHHHLVLVDVDGRLPEFLEYFHKVVAKHQNALRGRWENFWASEQTSAVHLVGPDDVLGKTTYTVTNPVKDQLVEKVRHWPGAVSLRATCDGRTLTATRPRRFFRENGPLPAKVELRCVRMPGFDHLSDADYRALLIREIARVEADAAAERRRTGRRVLGRRAILAQCPTDSPKSREPRRQLDPRIAARDKWPRIEAIAELKAFRTEYARIRRAWLAGEDVRFPPGTWWLPRFAGARCRPVCDTA